MGSPIQVDEVIADPTDHILSSVEDHQSAVATAKQPSIVKLRDKMVS